MVLMGGLKLETGEKAFTYQVFISNLTSPVLYPFNFTKNISATAQFERWLFFYPLPT